MTTYTGAAARTRGAPPRGGRHRQQPKSATPRATVQGQFGAKVLAAGLIGTAALAGAYALTSHVEGAHQGTPDSLGAKQLLGPGNQSAAGAPDSQTATLTADTSPGGANYLAGIAPSTTSDRLQTPTGSPTTNAFGFGVSGGFTLHFSPNPDTPFDVINTTLFGGLNVSPPTKIGDTERPNSGGVLPLQGSIDTQGSTAGQSSGLTFSGTGGSVSGAGLAQSTNPNIYQLTNNAVNSFFQEVKDLNLDSPFAIVPTTSTPGTVTVGPQEYNPVPYLDTTNLGLNGTPSFVDRFDVVNTSPNNASQAPVPDFLSLVNPPSGLSAANQGSDGTATFAERFAAASPNGAGSNMSTAAAAQDSTNLTGSDGSSGLKVAALNTTSGAQNSNGDGTQNSNGGGTQNSNGGSVQNSNGDGTQNSNGGGVQNSNGDGTPISAPPPASTPPPPPGPVYAGDPTSSKKGFG